MSRTHLPFHADDISALAKCLRGELTRCDHTPGHVELLNMLARSTGCRNFQHFRAQASAREALEAPRPPAPEPVDLVRVRRAARHFDAAGALIRWPSKFSERQVCLWVLWSRLPPRQPLSEKQVNEALQRHHHFGDYALLRREMVDGGLLRRTIDGREYRRVERRPPAEATALIGYVGGRHAT